MPNYTVLLHTDAFARTNTYLQALQTETLSPGAYLQTQLARTSLASLTPTNFLEHLIQTKNPKYLQKVPYLGMAPIGPCLNCPCSEMWA